MNTENSTTDSELIDQFIKGDKKAFENLLNRYRLQLYSYLCRMISDNETAKDLFQDVIMSVLKSLPQYNDEQKFSSWLFRIAHNTAMNFINRQKIKSTLMINTDELIEFETMSEESISIDDLLAKKEAAEILKSSIDKLPVEQKEIVLLRHHSEMPFKEIANMLDCPLNTVLGRMRYALLNLRKIIHLEIGGDISNVL